MSNEGYGRITGIRVYGRLGNQFQTSSAFQTPLANDAAQAMVTALKSKIVRREIIPNLNRTEVDTLKFVERARDIRQLCKTRNQERALRLAGALYKSYFLSNNDRKFDGIGQQDRTAATAALWQRARSSAEQLRSYAVLEETLEVASQKARLLGLSVIPKMLNQLNFETTIESIKGSGEEHSKDILGALEFIQSLAPLDAGTWVLLFRSVVDQLKAAVVLADMTIPGCPMICVNEAFCGITGYTREEAEGRNCRFLQGPATELESLRVIQRTLANRTDCQVAIHNYRKNGQIFLNLLSMRPIFDVDSNYTYSVAVQCEIDESCQIAQARRLRVLEDLLDMLPQDVPFKRTRFRDRVQAALPNVINNYDSDIEAAAIRRYTFLFTRLKWLSNPVKYMSGLLNITEIQNLVHKIIISKELGSATGLHAFQQVVSSKPQSRSRESGLLVLAQTFLPELMRSPKGVRFVDGVRQLEAELDPSCRLVSGSQTDPISMKPEDRHDEQFVAGFFHSLIDALRESPVACAISDMMTAGLPLVFANAQFLRLAGLGEADVVGKNCRFLQGDVTRTSHQYLVEEISTGIRERRSVLVKIFNCAYGRVFQNFIALHPIFATEGGEYLYQIGMQVNMNDKDEIVEAKLAELEELLAHLPNAVDTSSIADRQHLPVTQREPREAPEALVTVEHLPLPPIVEQNVDISVSRAACAPLESKSCGVAWDDMPNKDVDPKVRLELETECLDAIIGFTCVKWLQSPSETTWALLRQNGLCHDTFASFAASRSRVAKALVRCWDVIEEILSAPTALEQKRLALKYHAIWQENPLFLFSQTEIPVGSLRNLNFNWDPILKQLPQTQNRCVRVLSINVLPAFIRADSGRELVSNLLGHPKEPSGKPAQHGNNDVLETIQNDDNADYCQEDATGKLPSIPEVDPDLYTAAHHPQAGIPILSINGDCTNKAAFWLEMVTNLIGDNDVSAPRNKDRLQNLNGVVVDARDMSRVLSPETSSWISSLTGTFGESIVAEVQLALEATPAHSPRSAHIADGRLILFIQPYFSEDDTDAHKDPTYRIVFSLEQSNDLKQLKAFDAAARFLQYTPRTLSGRKSKADREEDIACLKTLLFFREDAREETTTNAVRTSLVGLPSPEPLLSPKPVLLSSPKKERPSTAPASRSVLSYMMSSWNMNDGPDGASELCSWTSRPSEPLQGLKSSAARSLVMTINRKLDTYVQRRRQEHADALNNGEFMCDDDERQSQHFDARSSSQLSTAQNLRNLIQERTALWRDGLMEKALELDEPIAQLQAQHLKERMSRLTRVLTNAKSKLEQQHYMRLRALMARHKQECMTLDKQIQEGLERLHEQHQKQTEDYITEVMTKTGAEVENEDDEVADVKPYLKKQQRYSLRTTTKSPEMVHELKMAKHLRRKKRYTEADDAERRARDIDLERTRKLCDSVKKAATGTRLQNLVQQQETALRIFQRRQASRLLNLQRRQQSAISNLENLLRVEQSKVEKRYRNKFQQNKLDSDEEDDEIPSSTWRTSNSTPRPPSAPSRFRGGSARRGSFIKG